MKLIFSKGKRSSITSASINFKIPRKFLIYGHHFQWAFLKHQPSSCSLFCFWPIALLCVSLGILSLSSSLSFIFYPTFLVCPVCFAANFWKVHFFWKPSKEIFIHLATFSKLLNVSMPTVFLGIAVTASGLFKWKFSRHKTPPPYTHYNMFLFSFNIPFYPK